LMAVEALWKNASSKGGSTYLGSRIFNTIDNEGYGYVTAK